MVIGAKTLGASRPLGGEKALNMTVSVPMEIDPVLPMVWKQLQGLWRRSRYLVLVQSHHYQIVLVQCHHPSLLPALASPALTISTATTMDELNLLWCKSIIIVTIVGMMMKLINDLIFFFSLVFWLLNSKTLLWMTKRCKLKHVHCIFFSVLYILVFSLLWSNAMYGIFQMEWVISIYIWIWI